MPPLPATHTESAPPPARPFSDHTWSEFYVRAGLNCIPLGALTKSLDISCIRKRIGFRASLLATFYNLRNIGLKSSDIEECLQLGNNLAISINCVNDLIVLDFDQAGSFENFKTQHPEIAYQTPVTKTKRGYHLYVRCMDKNLNSGKLSYKGKIIGDLKVHGYIVAPPSRHPNGGFYSWLPGQTPLDTPYAQIESVESIGYKVVESERLPYGLDGTLRAISKISLTDFCKRCLWRLGIIPPDKLRRNNLH